MPNAYTVTRKSQAEQICKICKAPLGFRQVISMNANPDEEREEILWTVHARLCADTLDQRISEERRNRAREAEDAERERIMAEREVRKAQRGEWTNFAERALISELSKSGELPKSERQLFYVVHMAQSDIEIFHKEKAKFTERLDSDDPTYALSWSHDLFRAAALYKAAILLKHAFDAGNSIEEMAYNFRYEMFRRAKNAATYSTSPTSNLVEACFLEACAEYCARLETIGEESAS